MAAALSNTTPFSSYVFHRSHHQQPSASISTFNVSNSSKHRSFKPLFSQSTLTSNPNVNHHTSVISAATSDSSSSTSATSFHGVCYVVGDNIDTDQIIPAEYLTLVPSKPDEYKKLGSYSLIGRPETRFVEPEEYQSKFSIIIAGDNFGCGSSREHAPVALGAAGVAAVVAKSYARIFFRNSVATGEIYPLESEVRVCDECRTGDVVTIELERSHLINHTTGKVYKLKPIGDAGPVIEAGVIPTLKWNIRFLLWLTFGLALIATVIATVEVIEAAKRRPDMLVQVGLEYRFMPPVAKLIDIHNGGKLGHVKMVSISEHRFPFLV